MFMCFLLIGKIGATSYSLSQKHDKTSIKLKKKCFLHFALQNSHQLKEYEKTLSFAVSSYLIS